MNQFPVVSMVFDGDIISVPAQMGQPRADQLQGSKLDQLTELAGRICYDSLGSGRSSAEYHKHIIEVGHLSTHEHAHIHGALVNITPSHYFQCCETLMNRPGVYVIATPERPDQSLVNLRITANLRAIREWHRRQYLFNNNLATQIGNALYGYAARLAPLACGDLARPESAFSMTLFQPQDDAEVMASLCFTGISRGLCYDAETEVLTEDGWKFWPDIRGDEVFATLNPENGHLEYQEASCVTRERYIGKMYRLKSSKVDLLVTPNHRLYIKKHDTQAARRKEETWSIRVPEEIYGKRVHYKCDAIWVGENPSHIEIPDVSVIAKTKRVGGTREIVCAGTRIRTRVFVEFLGYWLAEGHLDHTPDSGYMTILTQNINSDAWDDMILCVESLGFPYSVAPNGVSELSRRIKISGGKALYDYLLPYAGSHKKAIPSEIKKLCPELQEVLIQAHLAGDGSFSDRSSGEANTVSRQLADDLQEAALKAGYTATVRFVDRRDEPTRYLNGKPIRNGYSYVVSYRKRVKQPLVNHNGHRNDSWVHYEGMIYCATVSNGLLYVRRNGRPVWSGNSHELVRHRTGVSQRSSRFCDESESPWIPHPLLLQDPELMAEFDLVRGVGIAAYDKMVKYLQDKMVAAGLDKTSARKQSRGAARGILGNALETQLIFTASIWHWKHMLGLRASEFADAEIRVAFNQVYELLSARYPDRFVGWSTKPCRDGIGFSVEAPESA